MELEELREWLAKIEVFEAGVQGMTFWTHLTRDHMFRPPLIKGLTEVGAGEITRGGSFRVLNGWVSRAESLARSPCQSKHTPISG